MLPIIRCNPYKSDAEAVPSASFSAIVDAVPSDAVSVSLSTSGWAQSGSVYNQTVSVTGVTASNTVIIGLASDASETARKQHANSMIN